MDVPLLKYFHRCVQFGCHLQSQEGEGFPSSRGASRLCRNERATWESARSQNALVKVQAAPSSRSLRPRALLRLAQVLGSFSGGLGLEPWRGSRASAPEPGPPPPHAAPLPFPPLASASRRSPHGPVRASSLLQRTGPLRPRPPSLLP